MNMKKTLYLFLCTAMAIASGCGGGNGKKAQADQIPAVNPHVEAFTSGAVSKSGDIYIVFSQEVPAGKADRGQIEKLVKIKPAVDGTWAFQDGRTLVFRPTKGFSRNTTYEVSAQLGEWFGAEGADGKFTFTFTTLPADIRAIFEAISIDPDNGDAYTAQITLFTPDAESAEEVEELVWFSEKATAQWDHASDGRQHTLTLSGLAAGEKAREFELKVGQNRAGIPRKSLLTFEIPGKDDFSVYSVEYISQPERYIEVTFTDALDQGQDMHGLAYIEDNSSETVSVDGNKLRLYPDSDTDGSVTVALSHALRSAKGALLGEDQTYEVSIMAMLPSVRFVGNGVIMPMSEQLTVPFQAVYLRGVTVRVIRIMESNIGQFFQENDYEGTSELMRVGRLVARKTIFLDEQGGDPGRWNTYAIDLRELMEPQPGAIYRVELSFTKDLSAYPCDQLEQMSKEQILARDEIKFREELDRYDEGGYYYYYYDEYDDWNDYNYSQRNDPCSGSYYRNRTVGRNVLATDLGLMATMGEENALTVSVHSLIDTKPVRGVTVEAYNYQHQKIGSALTDDKGQARISYGSGRPYYVAASLGKQRSYLRVDQGSALSLSSFDVAGEVVQKGLKGFIYGERGVWRPGDVIHLGFMLNDRSGRLPSNHPVTMELYTPLGQLYAKKTQTLNELGLYTFDFPTEEDALTGAWHVSAQVGGATFTKSLRIETIKPNRLKIEFDVAQGTTLLRGRTTEIPMHVEWLQGATARNLGYEIETNFTKVQTTFEGFAGYVFDDPSKEFEANDPSLITGTTNAEGDAMVRLRFDVGEDAPGMLSANLVARVYEESGDFSIDAFRLPYSPYESYVGINSPQKDQMQLNTGTSHRFGVAAVDYTGKALAQRTVEVEVYKVQWYWWWSSAGSRLANYISNSYNRPVRNFTLRTDAGGKAAFDLNFPNSDWGTYYIRVKDNSGGHSAGVMAYFDWPSMYGRRDADGSESATTIVVKTDRESYAPGEKMKVTFPSTEGSRAVVSIENGTRVLSTAQYECSGRETTVSIEATADMQPNAYIYVTLLQPYGATTNDLPIRMYGVVPVTVTSPRSRLSPVITMADEVRPESEYKITVSEGSGREMAYTLAIVDEGLLDLTRFKTPDPWRAFNAREALGVSTWDLYNYVVGAYGGRIEQVFSIGGDDELEGGAKAIVNRFAPVVVFDGPYLLKKGEKKSHTFGMPNYSGRVRVMAVAGNGEAYGSAEKSVMVRKPLMLLGTLPRVIGTNEEMVVPATVFAMKEGIGQVKVSIGVSENMEIVGEREQTLNFAKTGDKQARFRIRVKGAPGKGRVTIRASAGGESAEYATDIEIRSVRRPQVRVEAVTLQPGQQWKGEVAMPGAEGTNSLTLEVSDVQPVNLSSRLDYLLGYPHGCIEQITSKGFPQLYIGEFASLTATQKQAAQDAVKEVIRRMRSYQTPEGQFSYWPGGSSYYDWASVYATHFLLAAESKGYLVPDALKRDALTALRRSARGWKAERSAYLQSERMTQAYRLYVLTLAGTPETGAMNRLRESEPDDMSRWLLAAAYANAGFADVARELTAKTTGIGEAYGQYDMTFGSAVRDKALTLITLTLLGESAQAADVANEISRALASDDWLSTQTTAFALVALSQYMDKYRPGEAMGFSYAIGGKNESVSTTKNVWSAELLENAPAKESLSIRNDGESVLFARILTEGTPEQGDEEAYANGLTLTVAYRDMDGRPIDVASLAQGTNFTASVTVSNPSARAYNNIVLTQVFPAGWEILNTRFLNEGASDSQAAGVDYQDIRDDRVYSYIDRLPSGRRVTVDVNVAAVYPGRFYLPPVYCEAMYDHRIRANNEGTQVVVE